jgi:polar amino acid transport system permease protein
VTRLLLNITISLLLAGTFALVFWVLLSHDYRWDVIAEYRGNFLSGWFTTFGISLAAMILSVSIGALLTAGQLSGSRIPTGLSRAFVEIIRGTPLLTQILIGYYLVADAIGWDSRLGVGITILSCFAGAYLSEIFRAGIQSIPGTQWLSAKAIGLDGGQTYRLVIIPQAMRRVLPATAGQFANLIKDSSLLFVISVQEFTMQAREVKSNSYAAFEPYLLLVLGYFLLTFPISLWSRSLERRFAYEH